MKSVTLIALNSKYCHTSLAIRSIGSVCKEKGINVTLLERSVNEPFREIIKAIMLCNSDVYAFSCYLWNIELVSKICKDLKKLKPQCEILLGGPEVSHDPEEYPFADVIVCGEGEWAVAEYLLGDLTGKVIYKEPVDNLDNLPFCYTQNDMEENKHRLIYYESSRGCPFSCSYCLSSVEKGVRFKSFEKVCSELRQFDNAKVDLVKFVDRTFNADRERAIKIWKFAAEECKHTKFHFELAGELLREEDFEFLKSVPAGKFQFEIGIQSTNPETLRAVDRKGSTAILFERIRQLMEMGNIHIHTDLIAGLPYETYEIFKKSFNDVYSLSADCLQLGFLKMLKGSKIRRESDMFAYRYSQVAPYEIYDNEFITSQEIFRLEMIAETVDRFYNSRAFEKSIAYAVAQFGSPFEFYERFSKEFDGRGAVAQKKLYEILYMFFAKVFGEDKLFTEYLKFDWTKQTKGSPLPAFMGAQKTLQPLLFDLLGDENFRSEYLPEFCNMKSKEIVKQVFIGEFQIPHTVYCLFYKDRVIDITEACKRTDFVG